MKNIALAAILTIALLSCSDTTTTPPISTTGGTTMPKEGSFFIYRVVDLDSLNHEIDSSARIDTFKVIASGITQYGKSNVIQLKANGPGFFSYESTGDISFTTESRGVTYWLTLPIVSKGERTLSIPDTSEPHTLKATYDGDGNIAVGSEILAAQKVVVETAFNFGRDPLEHLWMSRKLGMIVKLEVLSGRDRYSIQRNGRRFVLQSYTLK